MSRREQIGVGSRARSDADLLLPRPPGVLRRFWARHPRVTDALVAVAALLLSVPTITLRSAGPPQTLAQTWPAIALVVAATIALLWRRRVPLLVFVVTLIPALVLPPQLSPSAHLIVAFAAYAVGAYRSARVCWIAFGVAAASLGLYWSIVYALGAMTLALSISGAVAGVVSVLIGSLIGINVGSRRRYTEALIERSRQLLVERDQQAQLAAAAERTRIAREMHDIVSHSLTVIVALSEGAAAAGSIDRARQASLGAAETARSALDEMREMLGVLRGGDERSPLEPLEPVDPAGVVEAAQRAGLPIMLETVGARSDLPRAVRFALGRVVQESVTNVMRHAPRATRVGVRIAVDKERVSVTVRNDGVPRAGVGRGGGFGLRGLRERVEHVGGHLDAGHSGADEWLLRAELPVSPSTSEEDPE